MKQIRAPLVVLGSEAPSGSYVLRIHLRSSRALVFGRFKKGKPILLEAGEYAYIGSALGVNGASALDRRLVRHATRTPPRPPHPIREVLLEHFRHCGSGQGALLPKSGKKLFWNIDHLLNLESATLAQVFIVRSLRRLEDDLAQLLEQESVTTIFAKGLGAGDATGHTHILRVQADETWWQSLAIKLNALLEETKRSRRTYSKSKA